MSDLLPGQRRCGICGAHDRCFDLGQAMRLRDAPEDSSTGCVACLRAGRFGFFHVTEAGYLDKNGLTNYEDDEEQPPIQRVFCVDPEGGVVAGEQPRPQGVITRVVDATVSELRSTPSFPAWNEVAWMVHCEDFMAYRGVWSAKQFEGPSHPVSGRELFCRLLDRDYHFLWPEGASNPSWGDTCILVFQCLACGELRATADVS